MNIYEKIKEDHVKIKSLLQQIDQSDDPESREELFNAFKTELISHARAEEQTLYSALDQHDEHGDAEHGTEEHIEADALLMELAGAEDYGSDDWMERFRELKQALEHHIQEEETDIFQDAKSVIGEDEAEELADRMETLEETIQEKLEEI